MLNVAGSHRATTLVLFALGLIAQVVIVGMAVHAAGPTSAQGFGCDLNDPNSPAPEAFCVNATFGRRQQQITIDRRRPMWPSANHSRFSSAPPARAKPWM